MDIVLRLLGGMATVVALAVALYGLALAVGLGRCRTCRRLIPPMNAYCSRHGADQEPTLREGRRRMLASISDHVAELSQQAAQLNLFDVAEDIRSGWPTATTVVVEIDHTERPAELVITAIRDRAGDTLWPPAGAERWMESKWLAPESHASVAEGLAIAYNWHTASLGELVDECEGFEEYHVALDRFPS